jgi:hypothetical protein
VAEAVDSVRAVVLCDPAIASGPGQFAAIQAVASSLGVELRPVDVRDAGEIAPRAHRWRGACRRRRSCSATIPVRPTRRLTFERPPQLYDKQAEALFDPKRISVIEASTKSGKTSGAICWLFEEAFRSRSDPLPQR